MPVSHCTEHIAPHTTKLLFRKISIPATIFFEVKGQPGRYQTASAWIYPTLDHFPFLSLFITFKSEMLTDLEKAANCT